MDIHGKPRISTLTTKRSTWEEKAVSILHFFLIVIIQNDWFHVHVKMHVGRYLEIFGKSKNQKYFKLLYWCKQGNKLSLMYFEMVSIIIFLHALHEYHYVNGTRVTSTITFTPQVQYHNKFTSTKKQKRRPVNCQVRSVVCKNVATSLKIISFERICLLRMSPEYVSFQIWLSFWSVITMRTLELRLLPTLSDAMMVQTLFQAEHFSTLWTRESSLNSSALSLRSCVDCSWFVRRKHRRYVSIRCSWKIVLHNHSPLTYVCIHQTQTEKARNYPKNKRYECNYQRNCFGMSRSWWVRPWRLSCPIFCTTIREPQDPPDAQTSPCNPSMWTNHDYFLTTDFLQPRDQNEKFPQGQQNLQTFPHLAQWYIRPIEYDNHRSRGTQNATHLFSTFTHLIHYPLHPEYHYVPRVQKWRYSPLTFVLIVV